MAHRLMGNVGNCFVERSVDAGRGFGTCEGAAAYLVRPHALRFYAPLIRDLIDIRGGLAITNNNSATVATHPRVYR